MFLNNKQDEFVTIGEITAPHGVRGELRVVPRTSHPERYAQLTDVYVKPKRASQRLRFEVESTRTHRRFMLVKLRGVDDRNTADELRPALLQVTLDDVYPLPEGEYYVFQLVGLVVYDDTDRRLGVVKDVLETGANDVYVVQRDAGGGELLLPAIRQVVQNIDLERGRMDVSLLPGLE